jgi:GINS complex subunit 3
MGHLGGGSERDVRNATFSSAESSPIFIADQASQQGPDTPLAGIHHHILVRHLCVTVPLAHPTISDWADFNIPPPFGARVRNALKAEARSVKLSSLVGAGGLWYGFGKTLMDM